MTFASCKIVMHSDMHMALPLVHSIGNRPALRDAEGKPSRLAALLTTIASATTLSEGRTQGAAPPGTQLGSNHSLQYSKAAVDPR
jgi:hypothetical protein